MQSLSHTQIFYAGEDLYALDEKNRITIPVWWRHSPKGEGEEFIIIPANDDSHLRVMVPAEFMSIAAEVKSDPSVPARDRTIYLRDLHSRANHASSDKQGRLVIPDNLCRLAGLKTEVMLVGNLGSFEIWNPATRRQTQKEHKNISRRVADQFGH